MVQRIHPQLPGSRLVWLGSRGSDGKKLLSFDGMFGEYALWCCVAIGIMWLLKRGYSMFACLLL